MKNQAFTKQDRAVFPNLHCFVGTTDLRYLGERVREYSGLDWNKTNAKHVREQLDKIVVAIKSGTFRFAKVFPESKKAKHFSKKERALSGVKKPPEEILVRDHVNLHKGSGRVTGRTLAGYKSNIYLYLLPFFGDMPFADTNAFTFEEFISWARGRRYRKKPVQNETINKLFIPLRMIYKSAAVKYGMVHTTRFLASKGCLKVTPLRRYSRFPLKSS